MMMSLQSSALAIGAPALGVECLRRCVDITWGRVICAHGVAAMIVIEALDYALNLFGRLTTTT